VNTVMAILKSSLEEPLLTREQSSVVRAIVHAAQIAEAYTALQKIISNDDLKQVSNLSISHYQDLSQYLLAETNRVLISIKTPKRSGTTPTKVDSTTPSTVTKV